MRPIKFRAWDTENRRWMDSRDYAVCTCGNIFLRKSGTTDYYCTAGEQYVLEQFTGLLDKNGKEIYEGDILTVDWGGAEKSEYPLQKLGNPFVMEFRSYAWFPFDKYLPTPEDIQIVGNIHENPELLTESAKGGQKS